MNMLVADSLAGAAPAVRRLGAPCGPRTRVLFLHGMVLGNATYARELEAAAGEREDIEAVHVELHRSRAITALGKRLPVKRQRDFQRLRYMAMWRWLVQRWLRGVRAHERFDAVHYLTRDVAWGAWSAGLPYAVTTDATGPLEVREQGFPARFYAPVVRAEREIFRRAALVSCYSAWAARSVGEDFGVPAARILRSPPSLDVARLPPRRPHRGLFRLAFAGHHWERKGGPELVRWHQERWRHRAELHVFSSGAPPLDRLLNVVRHGGVARERLLREHLPDMDALVLPTREDAFGWVLVEAAAVGLPVVATRLGGIPEVVADGETGFLAPRGDRPAFVAAVERLIDDPVRAAAMGQAARRRVQEHLNAPRTYGALFEALSGISARAAHEGAHGTVGERRLPYHFPHGGLDVADDRTDAAARRESRSAAGARA